MTDKISELTKIICAFQSAATQYMAYPHEMERKALDQVICESLRLVSFEAEHDTIKTPNDSEIEGR